MKKSLLYFFIGTLSTFIFNYWIMGDDKSNWGLHLYYSFSFGIGWALAYYVDRPEWSLAKKMLTSFIGIFIILILGLLIFSFEEAIPSILRFSTVFVAYYLFASFKETKSLRK